MQNNNIFGKIEFVQSGRARYINVKINAAGLKIILPPHKTPEDAWRFINANEAQILAKQKKQKSLQKEKILNENSTLKTLTFEISLQRAKRDDIFFCMKNGMLTIEFPENADCTSENIKRQFWTGIKYFMRRDAKRILPARVQLLAEKFGFVFSDVKIQSSKTRWGSCSIKKSINLSFYLLLLPQELVDYVILHELCHTKEMNHGQRFWQLMDEVTDGKSTMLRQDIKKFKSPE